MIFIVFGSAIGLGSIYWFVNSYNSEERRYSNEELGFMSRRVMDDTRKLHRNMRTVLTVEEYESIDPLFKAPSIPTSGEPDI